MKKCSRSLFVLLLFGLFSFSEGKPCPERAKPHKTRCDIYYKCIELTADKYVWVPTACEQGLVYEHSLTVCVLPADDWECLTGDHKSNTNPDINSEQRPKKPNSNRDAEIYIVSNAEGEDINSNNRHDDDKVEIIVGPDISGEDKEEEREGEGELYDASGNGGELVELDDGFMPAAQNRETEIDDVPVMVPAEDMDIDMELKNKEQKTEQNVELEEMLQTIKTKSEIGQPSTNIDPRLTAHLQRLSQLIDGLKQTYQTPEAKPQSDQGLRPDQLNAFLAHFNIKNKFDSLDPAVSFPTAANNSTPKPNRTLHYNTHELNTKLNPETKVVLSHTLPHYYGSSSYENTNPAGGYTNSQIVVNHPEGSVHFSLPEHHYLEHSDYSGENTPKISEDTLKTVLELSKQMIAQQNVPKIIPSPTYFAPPILQPILLTPHVDSPFSTNYARPNVQNLNSAGFSEHYNNGQGYKPKKPIKKPYYNDGNNNYNVDVSDNYDSSNMANGYGNNKPATTIIHNNVIPVHVSSTNSGEKEVLDSYGQSLSLYPPHHEERPDSNSDYSDNFISNTGYSANFESNEYSVTTTKRPSYVSIAETSNPYSTTTRPFQTQPTADNYGSIPRPMKDKNPTLQMYPPSQENAETDYGYTSQNQIFSQINNNNLPARPNSHNYDNFENVNENLLNNYPDENNENESHSITYRYGNKKKPAQAQFSNYGDVGSQVSAFSTVLSSNNPYMPRPSSSSYYSSGKNKYTPSSSPLSSSYGEGTQLVNVGGNFISFDAFQNSILPLVGNNAAAFSSSLNNVELITCTAGVRQVNTTDCTRYYVCSKKDGKVLSYSCPPYTAFSSDTRICDAKTYAMCHPNPIIPTYSVSENKRIQLEALKALQEAKRHKQQQIQALKAQNVANLLQQYSPTSSSLSITNPFGQDSSEQNMLTSYMQQAASMSQNFGTTARPQLTTPTIKKRKYYCKEGDKIADQTSIYNYFVCYKNAKGQMKGHKMTCSKGLLFCPKTTMCTLSTKCS